MSNYIFTITAGRTGTAWLADFIRRNLRIPAIHEPLDIDDFGVQMPDIKTMRMFNDRGMNEYVTAFWDRKFQLLSGYQSYAETNHTLAKCGLLEFAANHLCDDNLTFLCVRRNRIQQCLSHLYRGDFQNITIDWQWYLSHRYAKILVDPTPLLQLGRLGVVMWYMFEMEVRQEYYKILYDGKFNFIDLNLEEMTQVDGARALAKMLGSDNEPVLGERMNQNNNVQRNPDLEQEVESAFQAVNFAPRELAQGYLAQGRRLG